MMFIPLILCLLLTWCSAAPNRLEHIIAPDNFFGTDYVVYTGKHDIVKIYVPFNRHNIMYDGPRTLFFVEADINESGKTDQGIYAFKDGKATKVLQNGRDAAATTENVVYFGASDGIYKYNPDTDSAVKLGTLNDNIVQLAHNSVTNTIYYLTANHEVFKLNNEATSSVKVTQVKNVKDLVFGYDGRMYYVDTENNVFVYNDVNNAEPKKVTGVPGKFDKLTLISALSGMKDSTILLVDKAVYVIKPDASITRELRPGTKVTIDVQLTAYGPQTLLVQYYAKDKKLYKFDIPEIIKDPNGPFASYVN